LGTDDGNILKKEDAFGVLDPEDTPLDQKNRPDY